MGRFQKLGAILSVLCTTAVPVLAQDASGVPPQGRGRFGPPAAGMFAIERMSAQLGLTDAQQSQIQALLASQRANLSAAMASLAQAERALASAATQTPADDNLVQSRAAEVSVVQAQLTLARAQTESRIYQLLSADQQQKVQQFLASMGQRAARRPGGR